MRRVPHLDDSLELASLAGTATSCGNLCDPACSYYADTPTGLDAGAGLTVDDAGISIRPTTTGGSCSTITITASPSDTVTLGDLTNPLPTASQKSITFSATCGVSGPPVQVQWAIASADYDYAAINSTTGVFTVYAPIAKDINVYARTGYAMATAIAHVKMNVTTGSCTNSALFGNTPSITDPAMILYPYAIAARPVVFPLAMTAPLVQYGTGGTNANCVRTTLCFPSGSCAPGSSAATFRWNKLVSGEPKQGSIDTTQPAVTIDQSAWNAFSTTAKSSDADIIVQRLNSTPAVMSQKVAKVHFASDALRGTVYFTQYQSTFTGSVSGQAYSFSASGYPATSVTTGQITTGTTCPVGNPTHVTTSGGSKVVSINLGSPGSSLVDAFSSYNTAGTGCPVCHSVSPDGKTLVTTGNLWQKWGGGGGNDVGINQVKSDGTLLPIADPPQYSFPWDSTTWAMSASSTATNYPGGGGVEPIEDSRGWPYAAISPDGRYVLQAPNSWGNTRDDISVNNAQDGSYSTSSLPTVNPTTPPGSGDKRMFLLDTAQYKPVVPWSSSNPTGSFEGSCDHATDAALPAYTGTATTLTAKSNGALAISAVNNSSSVTLTASQILLVKNETGANAKYNGVYVVSVAGNSSTKWILTRTLGTDTTGELAQDQRFRVDCGKSLGSGVGSQTGQFVVYYRITSADPITVGTSAINFGLWSTVRAVTNGASLPLSPGAAANPLAATGNGTLTSAFGPNDVLATGMRILVKDQTVAAQNGIYTITSLGSGSSKWQLTRAQDMDTSSELITGSRIRVTDGTNGGKVYELTTTGTINSTGLTFSPVGSNDSLLNATTMMVPQFSPDGTKLLYVNGDADPIGGSPDTGWRRGLSIMDVDLATQTFSSKRRVVNNYSAASAGATIKWPFFESDSRSIVYVQSDPNEFCPRLANYGQCGNETCTTTDSEVDTEIERACFEGSYGNMSPTTRGYWSGKLRSVDSSNPSSTNTELAWLNNNKRAEDSTRMNAADADKAYQPTVLPFSAGGYRWVIFTSQRSYGNQFNPVGTHFSCSSALLWMAALDDTTAGNTDRSYPAFLVPGQQVAKITNANHYVNERGYIVPSPCKALGSSCSVNAECCGATGSSPTTACTINTPVTTPVTRTCQSVQSCVATGQSCTKSSDCCVANATCFQGACAEPLKFYQATYSRDYAVDCTQSYGAGYQVAWGSLFWHAQATSSSSIVFTATSNSTGTFTGTETSVTLGTADCSNINVPPADSKSADVKAAFAKAFVPMGKYLRVTMTFNPSSDHTIAPTLYDWNLSYSCVPAE